MKKAFHKIDWIITLIPFISIVFLCAVFVRFPEKSNKLIQQVRFFLCNDFGTYYLAIGLFFFIVSLYIAFSDYGKIVLGQKNEQPKYKFWTWGTMMFTCGLAADILFYSFSEWLAYASDPHIKEMGRIQEWAGVYPLFHWGFIPWSFYLVLTVSFGFMLHVRKRQNQKYSEACRPLLKNKTDGPFGRLIDLTAVFSLIAGTATTFSVATPLISTFIIKIFSLDVSCTIISEFILVITFIIYTYAVLKKSKGISILANLCVILFFLLLAYVLLFGGQTRYIIETGFESFGRMTQNFLELSCFEDPLRKTSFPQNWTVYYWAYWMVWCVAAPFFIGSISKGRTIKQTILGGYLFGSGSTLVSFVILGNYSMGLQMTGKVNFLLQYHKTNDIYSTVVSIVETLPYPQLTMILTSITMIAFYATSFDSIALTASGYSCRNLKGNEKPPVSIQLLWCVLLIILPISLLFSKSSMSSLQSVSIIAAFPIGIILLLIVFSFLKDAKNFLK